MIARRAIAGVLGLFFVVGALGCAQVDDEESIIRPLRPVEVQSGADGDVGVSSVQSDDVQMSGRYRVTADGKLLRPEDAPIPSQPEYPEEARFETPEGAEAFVRYVIDLYEYMLVSGETDDFAKLCLSESEWCEKSIKNRKEVADSGGWVEEADLEIIQAQFPFEIDEYPGVWNSDIEVETKKLAGYDNGKLRAEEPSVVKLRLQMRFEGGRWGMHSFTKVK